MKQWVVDASVGVKWFLDENDREKAIAILDQMERREIEVIIPDIFYLELANVFQKGFRKGLIRFEEAQKSFEKIENLPLKRHRHEDLFDVALDNAMIFGITTYDAIYLSLAEIYLVPLVTADKEFYQACKKRFDFIEYLGDIKG